MYTSEFSASIYQTVNTENVHPIKLSDDPVKQGMF